MGRKCNSYFKIPKIVIKLIVNIISLLNQLFSFLYNYDENTQLKITDYFTSFWVKK